MPDSVVVQVHKKILEKMAVSDAGGYSGLDLTSAVVRGSVTDPPQIPFACVHFADALEDYGPTMGRFSTNSIFEIYVFAAGGSVAERSDNSLNLVSDCITALTADRTLGLAGLIDDIKCSYLSLDGDRYGVEGVGIGYIRCEVQFQTATGA